MKIIFLDVDGVLNYEGAEQKLPQGTYFVEDEKLALLRELVNQTGADLVLSSSWRSGWSVPQPGEEYMRFSMEVSRPYFMLCAKLHEFGLSLLSETPRLTNGSREDAINYWLGAWPGQTIEKYVILDDEARLFSASNEHLILVSSQTGLLHEHVEQAKHLLRTAPNRLLIVDDMAANRAVLRETLATEYRICEAENGREALRMLQQHSDIDMVITDIQMPEMDGVELIRRIRADHQYDHVSVIANTQYGDPEQEESIFDLGANDFIYKPSTPKIVKLRVKNALQLKNTL